MYQGLGFRVWGISSSLSRFRVQSLGYFIFAIAAWAQTVQGLGFRVQGAGVEFFLFAISAWVPIVGEETVPGGWRRGRAWDLP